MIKKDPLVAPVLKWVGGKRQLMDIIQPLIPKYSTYYEPFIGGGAVFFHEQPKKAIINDSNVELVNVYRVIQQYPQELIEKLKEHEEKNSEDYFYMIRAKDRDKEEYKNLSNIEKAARIIYLNKTCFNGLFRVNRFGEFNSPWGKYKNPNIKNSTTIHAMSQFLNKSNIKILEGDYQEALKGIRKGAFVYFDPPYMPISSSSSFTGYTAGGFGEKEQIQLRDFCNKLDKKGVKFLLSNSCCPLIEELYHNYQIIKVPAKRKVNADGTKRGTINEVLVRNYGSGIFNLTIKKNRID